MKRQVVAKSLARLRALAAAAREIEVLGIFEQLGMGTAEIRDASANPYISERVRKQSGFGRARLSLRKAAVVPRGYHPDLLHCKIWINTFVVAARWL